MLVPVFAEGAQNSSFHFKGFTQCSAHILILAMISCIDSCFVDYSSKHRLLAD
jgi:hypothetical protein